MDTTSDEGRARRGLVLGITTILTLAALVYGGYNLTIGLDRDDTNHLETPLAMAVARQLRDGPGTLYGPYSGERPLVLIHAPLYYRLAALGAWPLVGLGIDPVAAAMASGRGLAMLGWLLVLVMAGRMAVLDGGPRWAGLWAACLVATSPVFGSIPISVRPDTLGIALQTAGVALILQALRDATSRTATLAAAYVAFGLACCTRQQNVVATAVSSAMLIGAWSRRRAGLGPILAAHAIGLAVVVGYYGFEEVITRGRMSQSVFVLPGALREVSSASWGHVATVFNEVVRRSIGLIALGVACAWASPRRALGNGLDGALWAYLIAEVAAMVALCLNSNGAWVNYAMQPVVFASILVARAGARVLDEPSRIWRMVPALPAALVVLLAVTRLVAISANYREADRETLRRLVAAPEIVRHPASERYFVALPQHNRIYGRPDLAHDEWLYGSYEAASAADPRWRRLVEPRSRWLRSALRDGPVRLVIARRDPKRDPRAVPGLAETLPELGYRRVDEVGRGDVRYDLWER